MHTLPLLLAMILGLISRPAQAQQTIDIDLSGGSGGTVSRSLAGSYRIFIRNRVIKENAYTYAVDILVTDRTIAAFDWPNPKNPQAGVSGAPPRSLCDSVDAARNDIREAASEEDVATKAKAAEKYLQGDTYKNCPGLEALAGTRDLTRLDRMVEGVRDDQDLTVRIARKDRTWSYTFSGRDRGRWLTTYGFSYVADWFSGNQSYRAQPTSTAGQYTIARDSTNEHLSFVPTVMMSWLPAGGEFWGGFRYVVSAGLGFDLTDPVVMVAPMGFNFNQNLTLHVGIAAAKVNRLRGQYAVNQQIGDNLSADQLSEKVYRLNPFFSLSFNFSSNPFSTSAGKSSSKSQAAGTSGTSSASRKPGH